MRKIFLFITALVCASTLNLYAADTRTVISECSVTGWNPSLVQVGQNVGTAEGNIFQALHVPEGAVYNIPSSMVSLVRWDEKAQEFKSLPDDYVITAGIYKCGFQVRIDNSSGDNYGSNYRFPEHAEGCITFTLNGESAGEDCYAAVYSSFSYTYMGAPAFVVGNYDFKQDYYLPGKFSINATGDSIQFSQGNLQYYPHMVSWQFANNQYDIIGAGNTYIDSPSNPNDDDIIDLFGWGTGDQAGKYSTDNADYATFTDWAPAIKEDIGLTGKWRTLTKAEWTYISSGRTNAASLKAKATVAGQTGILLLPDDWDLTALPLNTTNNAYTDNVLELNQWLAWEAQGAVFLPAAGFRQGTTWNQQNMGVDFAAYWSASEGNTANNAACLLSAAAGVGMGNTQRSRGISVRLAREVEKKPSEAKFSVSAIRQVYFSPGNLQYHCKNQIWQFAAKQTDYIGSKNLQVAADYDGWIDLFGHGTGDDPLKLSEKYSDYGTFVDWGVNPISNSGNTPNEWRTMTSSEWKYLMMTRPQADSLWSFACIDGTNGIIILPDKWVLPADLNFKSAHEIGYTMDAYHNAYYFSEAAGGYSNNVYTAEQWTLMEKNGAVFLPSAGHRLVQDGNMYVPSGSVNNRGWYWSSTAVYPTSGDFLSIVNICVYPANSERLHYGLSVRLVKDCNPTPTAIENTSSSSENGREEALKILRNGQLLIIRNGKTYTITGAEWK